MLGGGHKVMADWDNLYLFFGFNYDSNCILLYLHFLKSQIMGMCITSRSFECFFSDTKIYTLSH